MASYVTPKKNAQFIFYVSLVSQANPKTFQSNPTLAAADFNVSTDGGSLGPLGTTPTVTPASGRMVKITLSAGEMNGDNITVVCSDAAGQEWCDLTINIQTSARQIDDLAYPATSGRSMVVDANGLVDSNVVKIGPTGSGTAQTARDLGASVLLSSGSGTGQISLASGAVTVGTNNDKSGYVLTQTFPSNFSSLSINGSGQVTLAQSFPSNFASLAIDSSGRVTLVPGQIVVKKNTARANFPIFLVLSSDHVTPATGKTPTVQRSIDGGAFADATNTPATEIGSGWYKINLSAADLNGDVIALKITATDCDARNIGILTQP